MAGASYNNVIRDANTGAQLAVIPLSAVIWQQFSMIVNDVGRAEMIVNTALHPELREVFEFIDGTSVDTIWEVWRRPARSLTYNYLDVTGFKNYTLQEQYLVRYIRDEILNDGRDRFTIVGRCKNHLLKRPLIYPRSAMPGTGPDVATISALYPWALPVEDAFMGVALGSKDTPHQMRSTMSWAKSTNAVALGDVTVPAATISGGIPNHYISLRYNELLEALQSMSAAAWYAGYWMLDGASGHGIDFKLVPASTAPYFPWTYTNKAPYGTDRRVGYTASPVIFSMQRGSVSQPVQIFDWSDARNRVVVGGAGDGKNRDVLRVDNDEDQVKGPWNVFEFWTDSRRIDPFGVLNEALEPPAYEYVVGGGIDQAVAHAWRYLRERGERNEFSFRPTDAYNTEYGVDYALGDLVSGQFKDSTRDLQVTKIEVTLSAEHGEQLEVELSPLDGSRFKGRDAFDDIASALQQLMEMLKEAEDSSKRTDKAK